MEVRRMDGADEMEAAGMRRLPGGVGRQSVGSVFLGCHLKHKFHPLSLMEEKRREGGGQTWPS